MTGRSSASQTRAPTAVGKGKAKEEAPAKEWGTGGQTLGARTQVPPSFRSRDVGAGGAPVPVPSARRGASQQKQKERSPTPDWGVDDDDVIEIDSD